jgi:hypothetical protein
MKIKINSNKILTIVKALLMWLAPVVCFLLTCNAYIVYTGNPSVYGMVTYLIQVLIFVPLMCLTFDYALKTTVKTIYKKRIKKTNEISKLFKLKTYFEINEFPDKYYKVYDDHDNFIGYLVNKKEI